MSFLDKFFGKNEKVEIREIIVKEENVNLLTEYFKEQLLKGIQKENITLEFAEKESAYIINNLWIQQNMLLFDKMNSNSPFISVNIEEFKKAYSNALKELKNVA